jgi:hypothetical protein
MATIDPSIALNVKPIQIEDPVNRFARQQELSVNMMKANEMQQAVQDRNLLRQLDPSSKDYISQVGRINPKLALELQEGRQKTKKTGLEIDEKQLTLHRERVADLALNPSPENTAAHIQDAIIRGDITPEQGAATLKQTLAMPIEQRKQYFMQMGVNAEKRLSDLTTRRGQDISAQTTRRGQDIGRIPVGYRQTATGEIEPIPGGPTTTTLSPKEIQTREAKFPQATLAVKSFDSKSDSVLKDIERLRNHPGLSSITGIAAGRLPGVTAQGREALELYEKIVSGLQFKELQDMRNASPTGGALGNVSNQEGQQLRQAAGALSRVQEAGSVQNELDRIADSIRGSKGRVREAYDMTYDYKAPAGGAAAPAPAAGSNNDPLGLRK